MAEESYEAPLQATQGAEADILSDRKGGAGVPRGVERRVARLEEWAKLTDTRIDRADGRFENLHDGFHDFKGQVVTRKDLTDNRNVLIGAVGLLVAIAGLIFGVIIPSMTPKPSPTPQVIFVPQALAPSLPPTRK